MNLCADFDDRQIDDFLKDVKTELKKNAVGVVFRAVNARFSSKYRNHEDLAPAGTSGAREDEAEAQHGGSPFPSKNRTGLLPPPMLVEQPPSPMEGESMLGDSILTNSPPGQILLLPSDDSSAPPSDSDRPERPKRHRVLSLFGRHHGNAPLSTNTVSVYLSTPRQLVALKQTLFSSLLGEKGFKPSPVDG